MWSIKRLRTLSASKIPSKIPYSFQRSELIEGQLNNNCHNNFFNLCRSFSVLHNLTRKSKVPVSNFILYICTHITLYSQKVSSFILNIPSCHPHFTNNYFSMKNTADVTGGKRIALWSQSVLCDCCWSFHRDHHQPIRVSTARVQAFLMDYT
jgi:hypothetical protein